jgi:S-adenosylmethionine hydrolase
MRQTGLPLIFTDILRQGLNYNDTVAKLGHARHTTPPDPSGIITLMPDASLSAYAVSVMKGEIARIAPQARVMDIQVGSTQQSFLSCSHRLAESARYFPAGTVHLAMVDAASGPQPRLLAARICSHFFITPDNGLLTVLLKQAAWCDEHTEIVVLDHPDYTLLNPPNAALLWGGMCSAAAHLTNGVPLRTLGTPITDPLLIDLPQPIHTAEGWEAEVAWVNLAGTLHTNLPVELLPEDRQTLQITIAGETITGIADEITPSAEGNLTAFINARGELAIMAVLGSAAEKLQAGLGTRITVKA